MRILVVGLAALVVVVGVDHAMANLVDTTPPDVDAGGPYFGVPQVPINLYGTATDLIDDGSPGVVVLYEWDFDGKNGIDWSSASTGNTSFAYPSVGEYVAVFRATDMAGNWAEAGTNVTITPEPTAFIIWSLLGALGLTIGWWRRRRAA